MSNKKIRLDSSNQEQLKEEGYIRPHILTPGSSYFAPGPPLPAWMMPCVPSSRMLESAKKPLLRFPRVRA